MTALSVSTASACTPRSTGRQPSMMTSHDALPCGHGDELPISSSSHITKSEGPSVIWRPAVTRASRRWGRRLRRVIFSCPRSKHHWAISETSDMFTKLATTLCRWAGIICWCAKYLMALRYELAKHGLSRSRTSLSLLRCRWFTALRVPPLGSSLLQL